MDTAAVKMVVFDIEVEITKVDNTTVASQYCGMLQYGGS